MRMRTPIWLIGLLVLSAGANAQSIDATAGSSQMYGSSGLYTEYRKGDVFGWTGIGYDSGMRYGGFYSVPMREMMSGLKGSRLEGGDQPVSALLDVDEYDTHRFTVRGVSLVRKADTSRLQVFGGELTEDAIQPYLHFASTGGSDLSETPMGAITYAHKFSKTLQMHSLNLFTDKLTSIQSMGWKPSSTWQFAGAAGVGFGSPYLSAVSAFQKTWMSLRTSYTVAGHDFHRQEGPYASNEPLGLNARIQLSPADPFRFGVAHEHTLTYMSEPIAGESSQTHPTVLSTFDSANGFVSFKGLRMSTSASTGKADNVAGNTTTEMATISRKLTSRWTTFGSDVNMRMPGGSSQALININEIRVSPRLALRQNYTRMNGQNTFSFGGEWRSNLLTFSIDQETYISPLAASLGGKSMFQAWTFSIRLRGPRGTNANVDTFVDPSGRMQWGGYLSGLHYNAVAPAQNDSPTISRYLIHGLVVDENGRGVWGIALTIGGEEIFSDENGEFFCHVRNGKPLPLHVDPNASLQSRPWQLETAPEMVQGRSDDTEGESVRVVIRMVSLVATKSRSQETPGR